jgi:hypothetical protein
VISLKFEKRDVILIVGLLLFMVGLTPFTGLALAMVIVIIMFFGIKLYVKKRKQSIENDVGEGICMECGSKVLDKKCPQCDYSKE